jgi:UDP-GlcNAc:undecaprenyl-phosphate/decaprenyl-phosphate GlcNAc-1-phosphate transferase
MWSSSWKASLSANLRGAPLCRSSVLILLTTVVTAAAAALVLTPLMASAAIRHGVLGRSRPGAPATPRLGGVAVCLAMSLALGVAVVFAPESLGARPEEPVPFLLAALISAWMIFAAGVADDLWHLTPGAKLLAQTSAALVAFALGIRIETVTVGSSSLALGLFALPCTVLWIVGVTNAFNLIDGLDGLATGLAVVALATTAGVAIALNNGDVALMCAALGGALLGFLRYNLRPARIFLGDSGSLLVGLMLAVLSVHGSSKSATAVLAVIPIFVLGLPLLDTAFSILRRWLRGTPVWGADERHVHHRLLAIGLTHTRAVVLLYLLATALAVVGVVLALGPPRMVTYFAVGGAGASAGLLLYAIRRLGYHEFVEAGVVVTSVVARLRGRIRDQIHARDVAHVIALAESQDHLQAILADNAETLGLLHATVCRESERDLGRRTLPEAVRARACRLDVPVADAGDSADPLVLRVWWDGRPETWPASERVVQVLADAVGDWRTHHPDSAVHAWRTPGLAVTG